MHALARLMQVAGLVVVGAGAVAGFFIQVPERTMWLLWGGGGLVFLLGTGLLRRAS